MALRSKTFRSSEDIFKALKFKADELGISESDVVNKALRCFLGLGIDEKCSSYDELNNLKTQLETIIKLNNLKTEG